MSSCAQSSLSPTSWPTALTPLSVRAARDQLTCALCLSQAHSVSLNTAGAAAGRARLGEAACIVGRDGASTYKGSLQLTLYGPLAWVDLRRPARLSGQACWLRARQPCTIPAFPSTLPQHRLYVSTACSEDSKQHQASQAVRLPAPTYPAAQSVRGILDSEHHTASPQQHLGTERPCASCCGAGPADPWPCLQPAASGQGSRPQVWSQVLGSAVLGQDCLELDRSLINRCCLVCLPACRVKTTMASLCGLLQDSYHAQQPYRSIAQ